VNELKQELSSLKDRIAKMTGDIDSLTNLVRNVNLEDKKIKTEDDVVAGSKRKKMDDITSKSSEMEIDSMPVNSDISNIAFTPSNIFPPAPMIRENSETSNITDVAFVDELFNALDDSDMDILPDPLVGDIVPEVVESSCVSSTVSTETTQPASPVKEEHQETVPLRNPNSPDPALMKKLSDALTVLPKDMQELLVNRLIATITSSDCLKAHLDSISEGKDTVTLETKPQKKVIPTSPSIEKNPEVALPLAAATLAALMTQFSATMKNNKSCVANSKSLPVIPIHA
jgi:hypothetical protein